MVEDKITGQVIKNLLSSEEPSIRYMLASKVMTGDLPLSEVDSLREAIRNSSRVKALLSERDTHGRIPLRAYSKWRGAHWVLVHLADLGYPPGDKSLLPLRDQVYEWLFSEGHWKSIKTIDGRVRRCASQEGNALYATLVLGLADERADELANRLVSWQWPDGGWNCDKKPGAVNSSFMESLIPLRGLAAHHRFTGDERSKIAAERAAEIFLKRKMYKAQRDGSLVYEDFIRLHYPCYWHYDILFGLKVLAEAGFVRDERCHDALDLLEAKRLPDGGFPAEKKYYQVSEKAASGRSLVNWGGTSKRKLNPFVTVDALYVLQSAGRLL